VLFRRLVPGCVADPTGCGNNRTARAQAPSSAMMVSVHIRKYSENNAASVLIHIC